MQLAACALRRAAELVGLRGLVGLSSLAVRLTLAAVGVAMACRPCEGLALVTLVRRGVGAEF